MKKTIQLLVGLGMLMAIITQLNCTKKDEQVNICNCRDLEYCEDGVCKQKEGTFYLNNAAIITGTTMYWGVVDCYNCSDTIVFSQFAVNDHDPCNWFRLYYGLEAQQGVVSDIPCVVEQYSEDDFLLWSPNFPACMGHEWLFRCKIFRQDSVQLQIVKLNFGQPVYPQDTCFVTLVH